MRKILVTIAVFAVALSVACNESSTEPPAQTSTAPTTKAAPPPVKDAPPPSFGNDKVEELAGTSFTLDSGEEVGILSVGDFDTQLNLLDGLIAIEGRVAEVFADRGAFVLVDADRMAGCSDGCCPDVEVPVRIALEEYEGGLPEADSQIVVVGDLEVTKMGYDFAVREIRQGEEVLLSPKIESV